MAGLGESGHQLPRLAIRGGCSRRRAAGGGPTQLRLPPRERLARRVQQTRLAGTGPPQAERDGCQGRGLLTGGRSASRASAPIPPWAQKTVVARWRSSTPPRRAGGSEAAAQLAGPREGTGLPRPFSSTPSQAATPCRAVPRRAKSERFAAGLAAKEAPAGDRGAERTPPGAGPVRAAGPASSVLFFPTRRYICSGEAAPGPPLAARLTPRTRARLG